MKIVILVLSSHSGLYDFFKQTWLAMQEYCKRKDLDITVFFTYANPHSDESCKIINGCDIICKTQDGPLNGGVFRKTVMAMEYVYKNFDFDYLVQSNLSSIIIPDRLLNRLKECPKSNFFGGHAFQIGNTTERCINWGIMSLSRDVLRKVIDEFPKSLSGPADLQFSRRLKRYVPINERLTDLAIYCVSSQSPAVMTLPRGHRVQNQYSLGTGCDDLLKKHTSVVWIRVRHHDRNYDKITHQDIRNYFQSN